LDRSILPRSYKPNRFRCFPDGPVKNVFRGALCYRRILFPIIHVVLDYAESFREKSLQS
jgi:hypothetical protein